MAVVRLQSAWRAYVAHCTYVEIMFERFLQQEKELEEQEKQQRMLADR